jgi:aldose 1-epimerase
MTVVGYNSCVIQKQPAVATTPAGQAVDAYVLTAGATRVRILTWGGIITHLFTPDLDGVAGDVVLGFDDDASYFDAKHPYFGAIIGRVGNRIAKGKFTLDGVGYTLATNNGANHLHGGKVGYDKRVWTATAIDDPVAPQLELTLRDADGTEGYPGTLDVTVAYTLRDGVLRIDYRATTDRATPINLTNHSYFNLHDAGASPMTEHVLQIDADQYLAVDAGLIPTGEPVPVRGTPIDFTTAKPIGKDLVAMGGDPAGYDHNLVLRPASGQSLRRAARVVDPASGRSMECWTTEPGVQFYTGNFLDSTLTGKGGAKYATHHAFCLETQHYPDSINHPTYPNTVLRSGETFVSATEYRFGRA